MTTFKKLIPIITFSILLMGWPATGWASNSVLPQWMPLGLEGQEILTVKFESAYVYFGTTQGLHCFDSTSYSWQELTHEGVAGWPVTAIGRAPNFPEIMITGRLNPEGEGALVLTQVSDGFSEVSLDGLPGPVSQVDHTGYAANYRVWACIPGDNEAGLVFKTGSGGELWTEITGHGLSSPRTFTSVGHYLNGNYVALTILAGNGALLKTQDNGETFSPVFEDCPATDFNSFLLSPACPVGIPKTLDLDCLVYLGATNSGLYFKDDLGLPWELILDEPVVKVRHVAYPYGQWICALTQDGVLLGATLDDNNNWVWEDLRDDLYEAQITDFDFAWNRLIVGTATLGAFEKFLHIPSSDVPNLTSDWEFVAAPNPFNPTTVFSFVVPSAGLAELTIFDLRGRKIETVLHRNLEAGHIDVPWQPKNLTSGIYLAQLKMGGKVAVQRLVLCR